MSSSTPYTPGRPSSSADFEGVGTVVTGGAGGLGQATVRRLHALGAHIVIADTAEEHARRLAAELGDRVTVVRCDVVQASEVAAAVAAAERAPRGYRVAVSCAGVGFEGVLVNDAGEPHPLDTFEQHLRVNLQGTFNVLRLAAASMRKNAPSQDGERGVVILTGSVNAYEGAAGEVQYSASKGGVHALTLPSARELSTCGIRVNTIAPGPFLTGMMREQTADLQEKYAERLAFPKRFGYPSEFASLVEEIAHNRMINGSVIRIDGAGRYG